MFEKKQYYISKFSFENRYCVEREIEVVSCYEKWFLTKDEHKKEYAILFEKIGNLLPDLKELFFELPVHQSIIYPLDLIEKSNIYVCENEIGFVYPAQILEYQTCDQVMEKDKKVKVKFLQLLCETIENIHKKGIYLAGLDKKQIMIDKGKIRIRYNGFKNHNRNSIYRVPDYIAENYSSNPWILDVFSLVSIIFEFMYNWHPFFGMMTSFSSYEEDQFDVFFNNFTKRIFIFDKKRKLNQIGFLMEQRPVLEKWNLTDTQICEFFESILTLDIREDYDSNNIFLKIQRLITYYEESELFQ